jgi:hypothetical protein
MRAQPRVMRLVPKCSFCGGGLVMRYRQA